MKPINKLIAGMTLAMLVATPMSMAQVIEEITVTARKKAENLQDVPISVNVVTSDMLDRMGIKDLQDITKLDPSLVFGFSHWWGFGRSFRWRCAGCRLGEYLSRL